MNPVNRLRSIVDVILRRHRFEEQMDEEMRFHLDEYVKELVRTGVPRAANPDKCPQDRMND